jgi:ubiquitin carboxyl-terminal hydrolase 25/28
MEDFENSTAILGFGMNYDLGVELDDDVEDEFIENAWKEVIKKSWKDSDNGADLQRKANEALRIVAEAQGRHKLRQVWQTKKLSLMSPDRAYKVLEVPENVDDLMLITVFALRVCSMLISDLKWLLTLNIDTGATSSDGHYA